MTIVPDKGIAIPPRAKTGRPTKYPWETMKVGESFVLPAATIAYARSHCSGASLRYGKRFQARKYRGSIRVWRIK